MNNIAAMNDIAVNGLVMSCACQDLKDTMRAVGEVTFAVNGLVMLCACQDLKDTMRAVGEVTFADAHKTRRNEG